MKGLITVVVIAIIALILLPSFFFTVDQTQYAVVLRFGEITKVVTEPGLHTKTPFIENVIKFDKRIQTYDVPAERIFTQDKKTLLVDTYALWRVNDPQKFLETVKTFAQANNRIDDIVYSVLRNRFGKLEYDTIISAERGSILQDITDLAAIEMKSFGIDIVAVRVKRADLPDENENAVYNRMKSEREQEAAQIRAEGEKAARELRATADKTVTITLAEAQRDAEILRGTGDASALAIYAEAFSADPDFYEFWKRLNVYDNTLNDAQFILSPQMDFIKKLTEGK